MSDGGTNIGYAMLPVTLSFQGITQEISRNLGVPVQRAAQQAGQNAGAALADGIEQAKGKVEAATTKIAAANKKVEDQTGKVRVAEQQLQALRDRGVTDAGKLAAAEEKIAAAQRNLTTAMGQQQNATGALANARQRLATARAEAANSANNETQATSRFGSSLTQMGAKAGGAIGNLKNLAVAAAGIGSAMELASTAMDMTESTALMNASLGATGKLAEDYGKSASALYAKGFGESMGDVTKAVEAVASTMPVIGFEGEVSLDKAAERAMNLSKVFGIDVAEGVQTAEQLITNGLAKDSTEAMDLMTAAMQRMPTALRGELPEILNEYGKHFQTFGLSGEAAMGLIVDMAPQGKIALDKTGDAIKELSIRATDGSKATTDAFKAINVDGDKMAKDIASGGPAAQDAMQQIAKGLMGIQDPAARAQQAIALFGTPLEDLGVDKIPGFLGALTGASGSMADAAGSADQLGKTLETPQTKLTALGRSIQTGLIDGLGSAVGWIGENSRLLKDLGVAAGVAGGALLIMAGPAVLTALKGMITSTRTWAIAQGALNLVMNMNPLGLVVTAIAALVAGIVVAYRNSETFRNIVAGAWQWIKDAASSVVSWFTDTALPFLGKVWDGIKAGWDMLVTAAGVAWDLITLPARTAITFFTETLPGLLSAGWELVKAGWNSLTASAAEVWRSVTEKFTGMVDFVKGLPAKIASTASGMWDGIGNAFKTVVNNMIRTWNMFAGKLSFTTPDWVPGLGGKKFSIPTIPEFSGGGWTGPGSKFKMAGVVHADEFVLSKAARSLLEKTNPGALDFMNSTGRWPTPRGYAEGGQVSATKLVDFARGVEGEPYKWGGVNWGDCSGAVSAIANYATGRDPFGSRFATGSEQGELAARGFKPGLGPTGSLNIGWFNGGPYGGHTAATLPNGTNFEMGGARGNGQFGGGAAGANDSSFTDHAHLPPEFFTGLDAGAPTTSGGPSGVSVSGGSGSTTGGSTSSGSGGSSAAPASASGTNTAAGKDGASGKDGKDDPGKELMGILGAGLKETFGIDGSWLPDIENLGIVKFINALAAVKITPVSADGKGSAPASAVSAAPASATPAAPASTAPEGVSPMIAGLVPGVGPGMPINIDASTTVNNPQGRPGDFERDVRRVQPEQRTRLAGAVPVGR